MNRSASILALILCLCFIAPTVPASPAKETWTSVRSQNFTVVSNAGEREMLKLATRFERFRQVISLLFPRTRTESPVPTTVVLFKNHDAFRPFKPRYKGKIKDHVGGYFRSTPDINYIALTAETRGINSFEVIFHEYMHFILRNNLPNAPVWLNEGLAEFYSTFETQDDNQKALIGVAIARHVLTLRNVRVLPLRTLLMVNHKSPEYNEASKAGIFYAQSWALVHYLLLGNGGKRQAQLSQFINSLGNDLPLEENFRQAFQADYKVIEDELRSYIGKYMFPAMSASLTKQEDLTREMQSVALSEAEAQYHLGDLLLRGNSLEEAEERLQKSLALDERLAASQVSLGLLRLRQKKLAEAKKLLGAALAGDSHNHLAHYYYAHALNEEEQYEAAITAYKQAITLKPDMAHVHADLGYIYLNTGRNKEAAEAFKQAERLDPRNPYLYRGRSLAYLRLGRGVLAATNALIYLKRQGWLDDHAPYMALIAHFGYRQGQREADAGKIIEEASARVNAADWPSPVLRYLQRAVSAEELLKLATDNDKLTEAHAYIGLDLSLGGRRDAALAHLRWVVEHGNRDFVEFPLAAAEIKRIEAAARSPAQ